MNTGALPAKHQVLQACRGELQEGNPMLRCAHELTALHERRLSAGCESMDEIDALRASLVRDIDRWITVQLPPAHGAAHVHTETMGAVIDRMAKFTAHAYAALASASEWDLWDAWQRLAELAVGYDDLAAEVSAGVRRLPGAS
ncbi:DUF4254 domain-containing protein [Nocardia sp. NBC_00508]|uniref:DUF4254 domain-containing protein n=1 Tax=Nocardia sp. NBC_00508 TaxID=2975992 RepID=UPI002E810A32|nr:DUF4254 domain-containing protein [Nocardia sp. NBC_00508]WUD68665.1 DUF4254 domain-containing protein [Nocardia sp. NBC_00508]